MGNDFVIRKLVSGGQTGVDRASLDLALERGIPCGGWCPRGRAAEDGPLPSKYPLIEPPNKEPIPEDIFAERTELNVQDSDGTLILLRGEAIGGTKLTIDFAIKHNKPYYLALMNGPLKRESFETWVRENRILVLNVAGPRESFSPGNIYRESKLFLQGLLGIE